MKTFPVMKDLVTDVSWNYEVNKTIPPFKLRKPTRRTELRMQQEDIDRVQEFRKCIECFLCQNVCHVLRDHETSTSSSARGSWSASPASRCTRSTTATGSPLLKDEVRHRLLQHHEVLHRGLPGAHQDHGQRDHPAQGAGGRPVLRPDAHPVGARPAGSGRTNQRAMRADDGGVRACPEGEGGPAHAPGA